MVKEALYNHGVRVAMAAMGLPEQMAEAFQADAATRSDTDEPEPLKEWEKPVHWSSRTSLDAGDVGMRQFGTGSTGVPGTV